MSEKLPDLSQLEIQCLRLMWKRKQASVREIHSDFDEAPGYSTIRKIIERLEEKGAVERIGHQGKALLYRSKVSQTEMVQKEVGRFLDTMFDGSALSLLSQLVDMDSVTESDLKSLQQYIKSEERDEL